MTTTEFTAEVEAGMAWLDENCPDWVQVFAEDRAAGLHMADCDRCVLGYVLGSYWHHDSPVRRTGAVPPWNLPPSTSSEDRDANGRLSAEIGAPLGFCLPWLEDDDPDRGLDDGERDWDMLGKVWVKAIEDRLAEL